MAGKSFCCPMNSGEASNWVKVNGI